MRLGLYLLPLAVLSLAACSDAKIEQARRDFGCGPVDGIRQITGRNQPGYVIVGEFTETSEAPAAFAEIACNLAAEDRLFVGVSEYLGGATDAETRMRQRLDALIAKGAPIIVGVISGQDREWSSRNRSATEKQWASEIAAKVAAAGAAHALLLVPHTDARDAAYLRTERFAGYDPMPMHLPEGQVMSLEIGSSPAVGLKEPAIRLYPKMTDGFHGQVALASLTRPGVALQLPDPDGREKAVEAGGIMADPSGDIPPPGVQEIRRTTGMATPDQPAGPPSFPPGEVRLDMPEPLVDLPDFKFED